MRIGEVAEKAAIMTTLPRVDLVYDLECPNVDGARAALRAALGEFGAGQVWQEWDRNSSETPFDLRRYGSPTILVNGRDIIGCMDQCVDQHMDECCRQANTAQPDGNACRVYTGDSGVLCGTPPASLILKALAGQEQTCAVQKS